MNKLLKLAVFFGLAEEHEIYDRAVSMPSDVLIIPPGSLVDGQLQTNMSVVVAGEMDGSINIRGDAQLLILEDGEVKNGMVSADYVEIHGVARNVAIDADRVNLLKTGKIEGKSELRYGKLNKHEDAPINGLLQKRKTPRDGFADLIQRPVDVISNS